MGLFGYIFLVLFLILLDKYYNNKMPNRFRKIFTFILLAMFLVSIIALTSYSIWITEVSVVKRVISGILAICLTLYFVYTIKVSFGKR